MNCPKCEHPLDEHMTPDSKPVATCWNKDCNREGITLRPEKLLALTDELAARYRNASALSSQLEAEYRARQKAAAMLRLNS